MSDKLHVEPEPTNTFCAYYDPEPGALVGRGTTREDAITDLLEQTDEKWSTAWTENQQLKRSLSEEQTKREALENEAVHLRQMFHDYMEDYEGIEWLAANAGSVRSRYNGSRILFSWNKADGHLRARCLRDFLRIENEREREKAGVTK